MRTEDGSIIQECLGGDPGAFGILVDKYKAGIYAFAYDKLRDFRDAQDVTQEVFEKAYRNLRSLRNWENFAFWLYRIARNHCKNWVRNQSRRPDREFIEDLDPAILEEQSLELYREDQAIESIWEALDSLPATYREVLILHYFGGMTIRDIARAIGVSPTAIGARLSRARAQLREEMVAAMGSVFEGQRLQASFTFRIVEAIKRIRIQPMPRVAALPWGLSLAAGIIVAVLSLNPYISLQNPIYMPTGLPLSSQAKVLKAGEIPVDVLKINQIPSMSTGQGEGDNGAFMPADQQNVSFHAPSAEGDTWTMKADMPTPRYYFSTSVVDGRIYAIGGTTNDGHLLSTVEEYDPERDRWTRKADMPTPRYWFSSSAVNGKIYAIGGWGGERVLPTVEEYDPVKDTWTEKADMPTARDALATSVANGRIYAIGGETRTNRLFTVEEYDPITDTWTRKADIPFRTPLDTPIGPVALSASTVNGKVYAIGGLLFVKQWVGSSMVREYDPATDKWTGKTDMPTWRGDLATSSANGKIYAIGGSSCTNFEGNWSNAVCYSTVEEYDPATDKWRRRASMPTAREALSASTVNGKIYVIGGWRRENGGACPLVEEYTPPGWPFNVSSQGKLPTTWGRVK